jgi:hypothetical protein
MTGVGAAIGRRLGQGAQSGRVRSQISWRSADAWIVDDLDEYFADRERRARSRHPRMARNAINDISERDGGGDVANRCPHK